MKKLVNGQYVDLTADEIAEIERQRIEWEAGADDRAAEAVRKERNTLIAETDWWATSDRTMTTEQAAYRQALRDITNQATFPNEVVWPVKPTEGN